MCDMYQKTNIDPCGLSQFFRVPEFNIKVGGVLTIPDTVSYEEAAMIEPLACCMRAILRSGGIQNGNSVAIFGVGPTGIMHQLLANYYGASKIFALDVNQFRLDFAKKLGATLTFNLIENNQNFIKIIKEQTEGRGVDVVILATGNTQAFIQALDIIRNGGKIILFGVPSKGTNITFDFNSLFIREIKIFPSLAASEIETKAALTLIENNSINISSIITHKFSLQNSQEAIQCAHKAIDAVKVVVIN